MPDEVVHNSAERADFQDRSRGAAADVTDMPCQMGVNRFPECVDLADEGQHVVKYTRQMRERSIF